MGNLINEMLYIVGIYKKRAKYIELCKNNRLKVKYPVIDKETGKLKMNNNKAKSIMEDIKINTHPIFDNTTGQSIYFGIEGETETFDLKQIHLKAVATEQDSLALSNAMERGRQLERYFSAAERMNDKVLLYLIIILVALALINICFSYFTMTGIEGSE